MKVLAKISLMVILGVSFVAPTYAQKVLWNELNQEAVKLYKQGQYSEATKVTKEALKVAEETFGPDHPDVAQSLNNLVELYRAQGKYAQAEPLYKRALTIWGKSLGPDHPDVATVLENMAGFYKNIGKGDEAKKLGERAKRIRSRNQ